MGLQGLREELAARIRELDQRVRERARLNVLVELERERERQRLGLIGEAGVQVVVFDAADIEVMPADDDDAGDAGHDDCRDDDDGGGLLKFLFQ
jgi:hypothetical protein